MWETTTDANAFLGAAGSFLRSKPVEHTVLLTVSERLARDAAAPEAENALLGWWTGGDGEVAAAFLHTPPYKLLIEAPPEPAAELGRELRGRALEGVNGEES